jgi:indolepyruvate ferredoxin oxidoreductase alpha subunit
MCPTGVLKPVDRANLKIGARPAFDGYQGVGEVPVLSREQRPARLSLAIRGVGGQGNLFFGHVLTQFALLAGYAEANIIKGETHGMAQMGGPVFSTFSCGRVLSPVLLPGTADCLIAMEKSEVLRPGFLDLLKPGGPVLLAATRMIPAGLPVEQYPDDEQLRKALEGYHVIEVDVLARALELGDLTGRIANVVMMGILSTLSPFNVFPAAVWLKALEKASSRPVVWAANQIAFNAGREQAAALEMQIS